MPNFEASGWNVGGSGIALVFITAGLSRFNIGPKIESSEPNTEETHRMTENGVPVLGESTRSTATGSIIDGFAEITSLNDNDLFASSHITHIIPEPAGGYARPS